MQEGWAGPDQFWHACFSDLPVTWQSSATSGGVAPTWAPPAHGARPPGGLRAGDVAGGPGRPGRRGARAAAVVLRLWAGPRRPARRGAGLADRGVGAQDAVERRARRAQPGAGPGRAGVLRPVRRGARRAALLGLEPAPARPAGVLLGLAVATRSYPLVLLLALVLLALRAGRLRSFATLAVTAARAVLVVTLPWLLSGDGVLAAYRAWWSAAAATARRGWCRRSTGTRCPAPLVDHPRGPRLGRWRSAAGAVFALSPRRRPDAGRGRPGAGGDRAGHRQGLPRSPACGCCPWSPCRPALARPPGLGRRRGAHFVAVWLYVGGLSTPDRGLPAGCMPCSSSRGSRRRLPGGRVWLRPPPARRPGRGRRRRPSPSALAADAEPRPGRGLGLTRRRAAPAVGLWTGDFSGDARLPVSS